MRSNSTLQVFLVLLLVGWPLVATSAGVFYDNTPEDISGGGTITGDISLVPATSPTRLYEPARTTDAAPYQLLIHAGDAYPGATGTNLVGGNLFMRGGIGARIITVTNYALSSGDTIVFDISTTTAALTSTTLTAGTTFTCATSNNACATALAAAVDALAGVSATAVGSVVYVVPDVDAMVVTVGAPADGGVDGAFATRTSSASGQVLLGMGSSSAPSLGFALDPDNGLYWAASNYWCTTSGGSAGLCFSATGPTLAQNMNAAGKAVYDSTRSLVLGATSCTTGHSLGTGDTCNNGALEVNGTTWIDGALYGPGIFKDVGATCTQYEIAVDTGGATVEICFCTATNTWYCAPAASGPAD